MSEIYLFLWFVLVLVVGTYAGWRLRSVSSEADQMTSYDIGYNRGYLAAREDMRKQMLDGKAECDE